LSQLIQFSIFVGFFNSFTTLLQQFLEPWGYSDDDAGIAGAILIGTGLIIAAIVSPIIDRYHIFLPVARVLAVVVAICYLLFISVIRPSAYAGICFLCAVLGAASFSLLPLALELSVELTHPIPPEVSSSIYWIGGQIVGAISIIIMDALRDDNGTPKNNMTQALIFEAVIACIAVPTLFFLRRKEGRLAMDIDARYK
jgi:FLVCR family MFS transporter 7